MASVRLADKLSMNEGFKNSERRRATLRWSALGVALLTAIILPFLLFGDPLEKAIGEAVSAATTPSKAFAIVVIALAADIFLPVPSSIVMSLSPFALGFFAASGANFLGLSTGALVGYVIGRRLGRPAVERWVAAEEYARFRDLSRRWGPYSIALCRAVPVLAEASVIAAGAGCMPLRQFCIVTVASNVGVAMVYAAIGAIAASEASLAMAIAGGSVLPGIAMVAVRLTWRRR